VARRVEADRLLKQAERDLGNARKTLGIDAFEVAAFLANQAVEKYLKGAWIVLKREAAPHTHSLTELGDGLGVPPSVREHLGYLNPDYVATRYPDAANGIPYEVYDRPTAERKVKAAEEALRWLRQLTQTKK
jgi:HEPN domain-containing protein